MQFYRVFVYLLAVIAGLLLVRSVEAGAAAPVPLVWQAALVGVWTWCVLTLRRTGRRGVRIGEGGEGDT